MNDPWPPPAGPPQNVPPPESPSRRAPIVAIIVIVALVGVVAVVSTVVADDDEADLPPDGLTLADLGPALLTEDDLDGSFARDPEEEALVTETGEPLPDDAEVRPECREGIDEFASDTDDGRDLDPDISAAAFGDESGMLSLRHTVSLRASGYPSFAEVVDVMNSCDRMVVETDGIRSEISGTTSEVEGLGDKAYEQVRHIDMTTPHRQEVQLEIYSLTVWRDGVISEISLDAQDGEPLDHDLVRELATSTDAQIRQILGG